ESLLLLRREDRAHAEESLALGARLRDVPARALAPGPHRQRVDQTAPDQALLLPVVPDQGLPEHLPRVPAPALASESPPERLVQHPAGVAEALPGQADVPEASPARPAHRADARRAPAPGVARPAAPPPGALENLRSWAAPDAFSPSLSCRGGKI